MPKGVYDRKPRGTYNKDGNAIEPKPVISFQTEIMIKPERKTKIYDIENKSFRCDLTFFFYDGSCTREYEVWLTKADHGLIRETFYPIDGGNTEHGGKIQVAASFVKTMLERINNLSKIDDNDDRDIEIDKIVNDVMDSYGVH